MSQTLVCDDAYLVTQAAPPFALTLEYDNKQNPFVNLVTPVGRLSYAHLAEPRAVGKNDDGSSQIKYSCTILMNPSSCGDIWKYHAILPVSGLMATTEHV